MRALRGEVFDFWLAHGPDRRHGGFHATLGRGGAVTAPTNKGVVQQARHLWSLSHALRARALRGRARRAAAAKAARSLFAFMRAHLARADEGQPGLWRWLVRRDGAAGVADASHLYGQMFAFYALTEYGRAFGDKEATRLALATFNATEAAFGDAGGTGGDRGVGGSHGGGGGYDETDCRPRLHAVRLAGGGMPRTLNIFLHAIGEGGQRERSSRRWRGRN